MKVYFIWKTYFSHHAVPGQTFYSTLFGKQKIKTKLWANHVDGKPLTTTNILRKHIKGHLPKAYPKFGRWNLLLEIRETLAQEASEKQTSRKEVACRLRAKQSKFQLQSSPRVLVRHCAEIYSKRATAFEDAQCCRPTFKLQRLLFFSPFYYKVKIINHAITFI